MAKLKLQPDPTFKAKVAIPVPGAAPVDVEFTFRFRSREEIQSFIDGSKDAGDVANILAIAAGWELIEPFNEESVKTLVTNYIGAPREIIEKYLDEHTKAARKN